MPVASFPPFPDDVPTCPLLVIDFHLLKARDPREIDRLWEAGTKLGFWYLKNHGIDDQVNDMFDLGDETLALPLHEKMNFNQGDGDMSFGYKAIGTHVVDEQGQTDSMEFLNISRDDALAWPKQAIRDYPIPVNEKMESVVIPFVKKSIEVNNTILDIFNDRLGLPPGEIVQRHNVHDLSGCEVRVTKMPPLQASKKALGSHSDFGSLSLLYNRLGGLQVLPPGESTWKYVKPIPGYAICNLGDTMAIFSGGILHSNIHRVMPPPGLQANAERWSLVYFTRPNLSVKLRALTEDSSMIADAVAKNPEKSFETGCTAKEWISRRFRYIKLTNRTGPESWKASRGTEAVDI